LLADMESKKAIDDDAKAKLTATVTEFKKTGTY